MYNKIKKLLLGIGKKNLSNRSKHPIVNRQSFLFKMKDNANSLELPLDSITSVAGKVLEKGEIVEYTTKENASRRYVPLAIGDRMKAVQHALWPDHKGWPDVCIHQYYQGQQ